MRSQAPEYPFPFAMDEAYDAYKLLHETKGRAIGMSGTALNVVLTGDSAFVPSSLPRSSSLNTHMQRSQHRYRHGRDRKSVV